MADSGGSEMSDFTATYSETATVESNSNHIGNGSVAYETVDSEESLRNRRRLNGTAVNHRDEDLRVSASG